MALIRAFSMRKFMCYTILEQDRKRSEGSVESSDLLAEIVRDLRAENAALKRSNGIMRDALETIIGIRFWHMDADHNPRSVAQSALRRSR